MNHEQIIQNQTILREEYEGFGEIRHARPAAHFEDTPSEISRPAPKLGEHGEEILNSLGISDSVRKELLNEGKIFITES